MAGPTRPNTFELTRESDTLRPAALPGSGLSSPPITDVQDRRSGAGPQLESKRCQLWPTPSQAIAGWCWLWATSGVGLDPRSQRGLVPRDCLPLLATSLAELFSTLT